jgi:hypothetical protein
MLKLHDDFLIIRITYMRILKRTYIQPQIEVIDFDNEGMICSSVEPNASNAIQVEDTYNQGGEHDGGGNDL